MINKHFLMCLMIFQMFSLCGNGLAYLSDMLMDKNEECYDIKFSINCFKAPDILTQANASFTIGYNISINDDGYPVDVAFLTFNESIRSLIRGAFDSEQVISCIRKWKFAGLNPRSTYTILLRWEHMKGWVTMMIYSDKMNLYVNLLPDKD